MTQHARPLTMRFALRAAADGRLEDGWLYLADSGKPTLDLPCLLVNDPDGHTHEIAAAHGFPQAGLDTQTIEDTAHAARQFQDPPSDALLLESFVYYWRFDAWLPSPNAPDPPPWEEAKLALDREFHDALGPERPEVPCRSGGCARGAIHHSVFCRVHHFESIRKEPCPFVD